MPVRPRILLTDDDPDFRSAASEGLTRRGFAVVEAADGLEAIETWDRDGGQFHLCLIDFNMPRANGIDVIRHVYDCVSRLASSNDQPAYSPCVLMSSELSEPIRQQAASFRVYRVLSKPLRLRQLGEVVASALAEVHGMRINES